MSSPQPPDYSAVVRALIRANRELTDALEKVVGHPDHSTSFVPTDFQKEILAVLAGKALRTDAIAAKVGNRRGLFRDPGGIPELIEEGLVAHHKRLGYYLPDNPPADLPAP